MTHVQEMLEEYAGMDSSNLMKRVEDDEDVIICNFREKNQKWEWIHTSQGITGITGEDGFIWIQWRWWNPSMQDEKFYQLGFSCCGNDSMITFNELETLNQTEIDFDDLES